MADQHKDEITALRERLRALEQATTSRAGAGGAASDRCAMGLARKAHRGAAVAVGVFLLVAGVSGVFLANGSRLGLQPLMLQLHTGSFLGPAAGFYCDILGLAAAILAVTGLYMYVTARPRGRAP